MTDKYIGLIISNITVYLKKPWDHFRSRKFVSFFFILLTFSVFVLYKYSANTNEASIYSIELQLCVNNLMSKYAAPLDQMDALVTESAREGRKINAYEKISKKIDQHIQNNDLTNEKLVDKSDEANYRTAGANDAGAASTEGEKESVNYLAFVANGYIGFVVSNQQKSLIGNQHNQLNLDLNFDPIVAITSKEYMNKYEILLEINSGLVQRVECFDNNGNCVQVESTYYAHRTRPSVFVQEILINNQYKDSIDFDVDQRGILNWINSKHRIERLFNKDFNITRGVIELEIDNKKKHLCISIGTVQLPKKINIKARDFNIKYEIITIIKYSPIFLSGKIENLETILNDLESKVISEFNEIGKLGIGVLKSQHIQAWNNIWKSGFSISNSLAAGAYNGDRLNSTIYYVLSSHRAPLIEDKSFSSQSVTSNSTVAKLSESKFELERCYEGFSTLDAPKLWSLVKNEMDVAKLTSLWVLTLRKHGCKNLVDLGVDGIMQSIVLSLGGFKYKNHHLDLNLNPRQLHRNYHFRNINYANLSLISVEVEVDMDNHAQLFVTLQELIDKAQEFYACDAGCIDPPLKLELNKREQFPVKLTNPPTSILYISNDKAHIDELKHALHVQEVNIAPAQDVNSVALHRHGHQLGGLSILFWALFILLIFVFHLFLFKLIYRELCLGGGSDSESYPSAPTNLREQLKNLVSLNKKYRNMRNV